MSIPPELPPIFSSTAVRRNNGFCQVCGDQCEEVDGTAEGNVSKLISLYNGSEIGGVLHSHDLTNFRLFEQYSFLDIGICPSSHPGPRALGASVVARLQIWLAAVCQAWYCAWSDGGGNGSRSLTYR